MELAHASQEAEPIAAHGLVARSAAAGFLLEALPTAACIVNSQGYIEAFNAAWRALASTHDFLHPFAGGHVDFLDRCARASEEGLRDLGARARHVLAYDGTLPHTHLSFDFAAGSGWFHARVAPLPVDRACLVLCEEITARLDAIRACTPSQL